MDIGCPNGQVQTSYDTFSAAVQATCVSGNQFQINEKEYTFEDIVCSQNPYHTAKYTLQTCELDNFEAEIGYFMNNTFIRQIRLCYDPRTQNTLYSEFEMPASIGYHQSGVPRPSFIQDSFYDVGDTTVNTLYTQNVQRQTINNLLGLPANSTKYVQENNDFFLARGHLAAKADFIYATQQRATFHFINIAPQWQTFNGRNWNNIEMDVRSYVDANLFDLVVYTGTYGVSTLPHEVTGEEIELYLYVNGDVRGIPVPEVYWKIVYDPLSKHGVALVGVNNPYKEELKPICDDISDEVSWVDWTVSGQTNGYIYACSIDSLREVVEYIPSLEVNGVLNF